MSKYRPGKTPYLDTFHAVHLCAELAFNYFLKMLGEIKSSILNENLVKYPRQIQHFVIDPKMELFVKIVNDFKL